MFGAIFSCLECVFCGETGASYTPIRYDYIEAGGGDYYHPACYAKKMNNVTDKEESDSGSFARTIGFGSKNIGTLNSLLGRCSTNHKSSHSTRSYLPEMRVSLGNEVQPLPLSLQQLRIPKHAVRRLTKGVRL